MREAEKDGEQLKEAGGVSRECMKLDSRGYWALLKSKIRDNARSAGSLGLRSATDF
jgi:hypothetical protein